MEFSESRASKWIDKVNDPAVALLLLSGIYLSVALAMSCIKLLWLDELITFHVAKLGGLHAIWSALAQGVDPNPPLTDLLVSGAMHVFGTSAVAVRVPAMLAGWVTIAATYFFVRARVPALFAATAALFFMCTASFDYTFESRSYALVLAFSALSLVTWRAALERPDKLWYSAALAVVLAAGLSSNYFAVLAFFPVAGGQLWYDVRHRQITWRVWIALAAGASVLLLYLPLINSAIAVFSPYAWNKVRFDTVSDTYTEMVETILWPALALLTAFAGWCWAEYSTRKWRLAMPGHELLAVLTLMAYPFIGYAVAEVRGNMLSPRFLLPVCLGFGMAIALVCYEMFHRSPRVSLGVLLLLVCWFFAREGVVARRYYDQRLALGRIIQTLPAGGDILVSDSLLVLPLEHYAPRDLASRLIFPVDFPAIRKYKTEDSPEQNLWAGRRVFPVRIMPLSAVLENNPGYIIAAPENNWLLRTLTDDKNALVPEMPIQTDSKDIGGFTPLCHGEVWYFSLPPTEMTPSAGLTRATTKQQDRD